MNGLQSDEGAELPVVSPLSSGPTVLRIGLGARLRALREGLSITREAAGDAIRASPAKISRLELGRVSFKERDIADLLTLYRIADSSERAQFLVLARQANTPGWWHRYADQLPQWFETFIGLEQAASVIRTYECQFVPGLLQTPDYARAVMALGAAGRDEVEQRLEVRLRRQRMLDSPDGPTLWAVIDEAALRRPLVGRELCGEQLSYLIEQCDRPNVRIQVAPLAGRGHPAAGGPFIILRFAEHDLPDIVYLEQLTSALYLDKRVDVDCYAAVMDQVCAQIPPPHQTAAILSALRAQL